MRVGEIVFGCSRYKLKGVWLELFSDIAASAVMPTTMFAKAAIQPMVVVIHEILRVFDRVGRKIYDARLMYARPFIDSLDFARNGQQIRGELPIVEMLRLTDVLSNPQGMLIYTVQGGVDSQEISWLGVNVTGICQLQCQRCLGAMEYEVKLVTRLLLRDQAALDALDDDEAEFDSVLADKHLDVVSLLEEEILLSLPIAPKHEFGACQAAKSQSPTEDETHPFAALAKLKSFNH